MKRFVPLFTVALLLLLLATPAVLADEASDAVRNLGVLIACLVVFLLVFSACSIYALYFLYTDAQARSGNGILWLLLGLINWPIVLIVWLIIRPEKKAP